MFTSDDGKVGGVNFKEIVFVRLDGEVWCDNSEEKSESQVTESEEFENWSVWKKKNKSGVDCKLSIARKGDKLELLVENGGLETRSLTPIPMDASNIYWYLTGDQCALTDIRYCPAL